MFSTSTLTPADFPMPDLHCPDWCEREHEADWKLHVAVGLDTRPIPAAGGGFLPDLRGPLSEWLETFEPLHLRQLVRVDLGYGQSADVDLQQGLDGKTFLYLVAEGVLTAELARTFAAELLNAADTLDRIEGQH